MYSLLFCIGSIGVVRNRVGVGVRRRVVADSSVVVSGGVLVGAAVVVKRGVVVGSGLVVGGGVVEAAESKAK